MNQVSLQTSQIEKTRNPCCKAIIVESKRASKTASAYMITSLRSETLCHAELNECVAKDCNNKSTARTPTPLKSQMIVLPGLDQLVILYSPNLWHDGLYVALTLCTNFLRFICLLTKIHVHKDPLRSMPRYSQPTSLQRVMSGVHHRRKVQLQQRNIASCPGDAPRSRSASCST